MTKLYLGVGVISSLLAAPADADSCRYEEPRGATIDAAGLERVVVDARAGSLAIVGKRGLAEVRAEGIACAGKRDHLESIRLVAQRTGTTATIEVEIPDTDWSLFSGASPRLDLEVEVPEGVALEVQDSSGAIEIRGVGSTEVRDSSGEIVVEDVSGDLRIEDSSGSIEVSDVSGDVRLEDSSGGIEVRRVGGSVVVDRDTSGSIEVEHVQQNVLVRRDSSGSISVADIGGDFTVERDGSGSIRYEDVKGRVDIPKDKR